MPEDNNITVMAAENCHVNKEDHKVKNIMCRTCTERQGPFTFIFSERHGQILSSLVTSLTSIKIEKGDGLPEVMCRRCVTSLETSLQFKWRAKQADQQMRAFLQVNSNDSQETHLLKTTPLPEKYKNSKQRSQKEAISLQVNEENPPTENLVELKYESDNVMVDPNISEFDRVPPKQLLNHEITNYEKPTLFQIMVRPYTISKPVEEEEDYVGNALKILNNSKIARKTGDILINDPKVPQKPILSNVSKARQKRLILNGYRGVRKNPPRKASPKILQEDPDTDHDNIELPSDDEESLKQSKDNSEAHHIRTLDEILKNVNVCIKNSSEEIRCPDCKVSFDSWQLAEDHRKTCEAALKGSCDSTLDLAGEIIPSEKGVKKPKSVGSYGRAKQGSCHYCDYNYRSGQDMMSHYRKSHPTQPIFLCHICGKGTRHKRSYIDHLETHSETRKFYICELCGSSLTTKSSFRVHKLFHCKSDPTRFVCEFCKKELRTKGTLKKHILGHYYRSGELKKPKKDYPYRCAFCNHGFENSYNKRAHEMVHTGDKPFKCDICSEGFRTNASLKTHQFNKHSDVMILPWRICPYCPKKFKTKEHLRCHIMMHNDEKPFNCTLCDAKYRFKANLKKHVSRHHLAKDPDPIRRQCEVDQNRHFETDQNGRGFEADQALRHCSDALSKLTQVN